MKPIRHVLIVVNPAAAGRQAAVDKGAAIALSQRATVELVVFDVASAHEPDLRFQRLKPLMRLLGDELVELLDALAQPLRRRGLDVAARVITAESLHRGILEFLRDSAADIIIKDCLAHSLPRRFQVNDTDWHLVRACPIPLLLTKAAPWHEPPTIMAAIDPSVGEANAVLLDHLLLDTAALLARDLQGDLHVIHSYVPASIGIAVGNERSFHSTGSRMDCETEKNSHREATADLSRLWGVGDTKVHVEMGTPNDGINRVAVRLHVDVTVMGALSRTNWRQRLIGSTAVRALDSIPCDLLVIKPGNF